MYFITTKRMLEVCFSAHPNIQYRTLDWGIVAGYLRDSYADSHVDGYISEKTVRHCLVVFLL